MQTMARRVKRLEDRAAWYRMPKPEGGFILVWVHPDGTLDGLDERHGAALARLRTHLEARGESPAVILYGPRPADMPVCVDDTPESAGRRRGAIFDVYDVGRAPHTPIEELRAIRHAVLARTEGGRV